MPPENTAAWRERPPATVQRGNALEAGQIPTPVAEDGYVFAGWSHTDPEDYEVVEDINSFTANFVRQEEQDNAATIVLSCQQTSGQTAAAMWDSL
ncbi:MAG: hypothetical protein ACLSHU_13375 [Oscillospiraceae bacterium]